MGYKADIFENHTMHKLQKFDYFKTIYILLIW